MPQVEPAVLVLLILAGSLVLFLSDRLRYDLVALLVVLALVVTRTLTPDEAFAGFASEPVVVVACLCLFGHALSRWGVGWSRTTVRLCESWWTNWRRMGSSSAH